MLWCGVVIIVYRPGFSIASLQLSYRGSSWVRTENMLFSHWFEILCLPWVFTGLICRLAFFYILYSGSILILTSKYGSEMKISLLGMNILWFMWISACSLVGSVLHISDFSNLLNLEYFEISLFFAKFVTEGNFPRLQICKDTRDYFIRLSISLDKHTLLVPLSSLFWV